MIAGVLYGLSFVAVIAAIVGLIFAASWATQRLGARPGKKNHASAVWTTAVGAMVGLLYGYLAYAPGFLPATKLRGAEFVGGDLLLNYETGGRSHSPKLRSLDLATGETLATKRMGSLGLITYEILGPAREAGKVWLHGDDLGVHQRDARSGEVVLRESEIVASNPLLSAGVASENYHTYYVLDEKTGDLCLETADHYIVRLDAARLQGERLTPTDQSRLCQPRRKPRATASRLQLGPRTRLEFDGAPRSVITRTDGNRSLPLDAARSYLKPEWVAEPGGGPLRFGEGPDADALLVYQDPDERHLALARVAVTTGTPRWSAPLAAVTYDPELRAAHLEPARLVLVTLGTVAALDPGDGHLLWTASY